ncbi:AMP-binding protein [Thermobifida alba]|uniref:AMP-binding protein n=1 Tax=Thermobifida alba TaxID=53522 RepID=A0ABY4KXA5_THEAE|nr:AMP-binding protein [Thermobifida alba]UPT20059.1 AMP-binding protein [Thermobifida alba]
MDARAAEHPDREALVFPDRRMTYAELAERADWFARGFVGLGVGAGDRVGILLPDCADIIAAIFGAAKVGVIPVPVNGRFKEYELSHLLNHSGMSVLVTRPPQPGGTDFPELVDAVLPGLAEARPERLDLADAPDLRQVLLLGSEERPGYLPEASFDAVARAASADEVTRRAQRVKTRDTAIIIYTSGTTAAPKGAMLSHEALCRFADTLANDRFRLTPDDRVWVPLPLFHIGGIAFSVMTIHARSVYVHSGFYRPDTALQQLQEERCTLALPCFETIWKPVLDRPDFAEYDLSALRTVLVTGVAERLRAMQEQLPHVVQVSTFGATEACSVLSVSSVDDSLEERVTTGGQVLPGMECRVVDPETGKDVPPNTLGELIYRGPNCFHGYFRDPELTRKVFDEDGWFHSGDLGTIDPDGRVTFVSRVKDMLKVGGENVAAAEAEGYLMRHPAVDFAQVVAAPDAYYTEVPAAFIQCKPGMTVTEEELIDFCLGKIATYRVPRYVRFVDEWPMSGTKIKKYVLREQITQELREKGITEAPRLRYQAKAAAGEAS